MNFVQLTPVRPGGYFKESNYELWVARVRSNGVFCRANGIVA